MYLKFGGVYVVWVTAFKVLTINLVWTCHEATHMGLAAKNGFCCL